MCAKSLLLPVLIWCFQCCNTIPREATEHLAARGVLPGKPENTLHHNDFDFTRDKNVRTILSVEEIEMQQTGNFILSSHTKNTNGVTMQELCEDSCRHTSLEVEVGSDVTIECKLRNVHNRIAITEVKIAWVYEQEGGNTCSIYDPSSTLVMPPCKNMATDIEDLVGTKAIASTFLLTNISINDTGTYKCKAIIPCCRGRPLTQPPTYLYMERNLFLTVSFPAKSKSAVIVVAVLGGIISLSIVAVLVMKSRGYMFPWEKIPKETTEREERMRRWSTASRRLTLVNTMGSISESDAEAAELRMRKISTMSGIIMRVPTDRCFHESDSDSMYGIQSSTGGDNTERRKKISTVSALHMLPTLPTIYSTPDMEGGSDNNHTEDKTESNASPENTTIDETTPLQSENWEDSEREDDRSSTDHENQEQQDTVSTDLHHNQTDTANQLLPSYKDEESESVDENTPLNLVNQNNDDMREVAYHEPNLKHEGDKAGPFSSSETKEETTKASTTEAEPAKEETRFPSTSPAGVGSVPSRNRSRRSGLTAISSTEAISAIRRNPSALPRSHSAQEGTKLSNGIVEENAGS